MNSPRYSRQMRLPGMGPEGQERIGRSRVLCVGVGGLGCPAALYLVAAGVGTLGLVDSDGVDMSNLHRQVLFKESEVGASKVDAARRTLSAFNQEVRIVSHAERLTSVNALEILRAYDIVVDGTDNFAAKFLINDAAARIGIPVVHGTLSQYEGRISVFWARRGPCYRCLHPHPPRSVIPNCAEAGVLGAVAGVIGTMQAVEALKLAVAADNRESPLRSLLGRMLVVDTSTMETSLFPVTKNPACPTCSVAPEAIQLMDLPERCAVAIDGAHVLSSQALRDQFENFLLLDVREPSEWEGGHIPGALNWPLSRITRGEWPPFETFLKPCVLYCQGGIRSARALEMLRPHAPMELKHLDGGVAAWSGPIVKKT